MIENAIRINYLDRKISCRDVRESVRYRHMTSVTATKARNRLYHLIAQIQGNSTPVLITGKHGNAVLISEDDWRSIEATLHLLSIPGMRESIRKGIKEPISKTSRTIDL